MKCPHCGVWTAVRETRGTRRRRECANGHRFATNEIPEVNVASRNRAMADAVVLGGQFMKDVAKSFGLKSDSYVSRVVRAHYPNFNARVTGQQRRFKST